MNKCIQMAVCLVALILTASETGLSQTMLRTLTLPNLSVQIALDHTSDGEPILFETFVTNDPDRHSVYCASGFLDVHYTLRDSSGHVVPAAQQPWKHSSDVPEGTMTGYVPGAPDPCTTVKARRSERRVLLTAVYPNLPHGTYTLQLKLAPRGRPDSATAEPITISL
jgi:hypothetical protein